MAVVFPGCCRCEEKCDDLHGAPHLFLVSFYAYLSHLAMDRNQPLSSPFGVFRAWKTPCSSRLTSIFKSRPTVAWFEAAPIHGHFSFSASEYASRIFAAWPVLLPPRRPFFFPSSFCR